MGWVGGGHLQSEALRVSVLPKSSHFLASEITEAYVQVEPLSAWILSGSSEEEPLANRQNTNSTS